METKSSFTILVFLAINLLFFTLTNAESADCNCSPSPKPKPPVPVPSKPKPPSTTPTPTPKPPSTTPTPTPKPPSTTPTPKPPSTTPTTPTGNTCPIDALKLGVCADVLGLINAKVGNPPVVPCCSLIDGLVDLEAALCLCTAIKANVLGINLNVPVDLSLILNYCNKTCPSGFTCP